VPSIRIKEESADAEVPTDHQLLRSVLKDTSFQRKYNIRPFELPTPSTNNAMSARQDIEDLEPVLDLAFQQVTQQVDNTCSALGITRGKLLHFCLRSILNSLATWIIYCARYFSIAGCIPYYYFLTINSSDLNSMEPAAAGMENCSFLEMLDGYCFSHLMEDIVNE